MQSDKIDKCLLEQFGLTEFRHSQRAIIESILSGKDTLAVMPTGGGKSLCFQLPALLLEGVTIVISPLIALMKDQVDSLKEKGIKAAYINSSQSLNEQIYVTQCLKNGEIKLLYIAPERFKAASFVQSLSGIKVSLFAVDEAHCISQWGHDFRPDYMKLARAIQILGNPPIAAFTATATEDVRLDIIKQLKMNAANVFVSGFARNNLSFNVRSVSTKKEKIERILDIIDEYKKGIIYCATVKSAESVSEELLANKVKHILYHGKMTPSQREDAQNEFMNGTCSVAVATNAFGMGIDRADIRFVCHYELSGSIESYYQEAGRAGRDALESYCEMLFMYADKRVQEFFIEGANPDLEFIKKLYSLLLKKCDKDGYCLLSIEDMTTLLSKGQKKVNQMAVSSALSILKRYDYIERFDSETSRIKGTRVCDKSVSEELLAIDAQALEQKKNRDMAKLKSVLAYAYSNSCRQEWILDYFGEKNLEKCGKCDKCKSGLSINSKELNEEELTIVRKALSCLARMSYKIDKNKWEPRFGKEKLIKCLMGSRDEKILSANLDKLSTYGILKEYGKTFVSSLVDEMLESNLIEVYNGEYPLIGLSDKGVAVMINSRNVIMEFPDIKKAKDKLKKEDKKTKEYATDELPSDEILYKKLVSKRNQLQHLRGKVPAYVIFPNSVLKRLADLKPKTIDEAMQIKGIGPQKAATILPSFLRIIEGA